MRHPSENFFEPAPLETYEGSGYQDLQRRIAWSNRFPLKAIAIASGLLNAGVLSATAGALRLFGLRPDHCDRELGKLYFHVPEMAVQKRIELRELAARPELAGSGVDIGCGNGYVGGLLKRMTAIESLHGIDPVASFSNDVTQNGYDGFSAAPADEIPLPSGSVDFVVSICVLEHVQNLDGALREALRVLKPGGAVVLTTPSPEFRSSNISGRLWAKLGIRRRAEAAAKRRDKVSMHFHYASDEEWRRNLNALGFEKIDVVPFFSQRQMLIYEFLNWPVAIPELYFCDKIWILCQKCRLLMKGLAWATALLTAWIVRWAVPPGCHTHWLVSGRRRLEDNVAG